MPGLTRRSNLPTAIADAKATELFSHGTDPLPEKGRVLVIVAADWCSHCHTMQKNNHYATATADGTPVRWMNDSMREAGAAISLLPGMGRDKAGMYALNGTSITSYPSVIEVIDGRATHIVSGVGDITARGALDKLSARLAANDKAQQQARDAVPAGCDIKAASACTVDTNDPFLNNILGKKPSGPALQK